MVPGISFVGCLGLVGVRERTVLCADKRGGVGMIE
jgi:hypothetical protein